MTREEIVNSMSLQDAIQVFRDTNAYGTMDIAKTVILKALEQEPCEYYDADNKTCRRSEVPKEPCEDVLDKIGAEIEQQRKEASNKHSEDAELQAYYDGLNDGLKDARDTIDKYRAESEVKEC